MSLETKVGGRFVLMKKLGQGSFGDIYLGRDSDKAPVAMKLEATRARHLQLAHEYRVLSSLHSGVGIPSVRWFGKEGDYRVLIMDLLGSDLEELRLKCASRRFSLKTVLMLADQLVSRLEFIHSRHYLHRDVKPENFLMGLNSNDHLVYAIDFGLAKSYRDPRTLRHATYREDCNLEGTARYASVNTHLGFEQSRRDDLESLGYMLIYLLRGSLPWQGLAGKTKAEKYAAISAKKMETSIETLTWGLPPEFATYLTYCINLTFTAEPNYLMLRRLFREAMTREGFEYDYMYDWVKAKRAPQPAPPHIPPLPEVSIPPPPALPRPSPDERVSVNFHADKQPIRAEEDGAPDGQNVVPEGQALESQHVTQESQSLADNNQNEAPTITPDGQNLPSDNCGDENYEQTSEAKLATERKEELRFEDAVEFAVSEMEENNNYEQNDELATNAESVATGRGSLSSHVQTESSPPISPSASRRGSDVTSAPTSPELQQPLIQITEPDHHSQPEPAPPPPTARTSVSGLLRAQHKVTPLPRVSPRYSAHSATSKTLAVFGNKHMSLPAPISMTQPPNSAGAVGAPPPTATAGPMASVTIGSARSPGRQPPPPAGPTPSRRISAGEKPWHQPRSPGRKDSRRGVASPSPKA